MGPKRQSKSSIKMLNQDFVKISKSSDDYVFEIGESITTDPAEAVALMMRINDLHEMNWKKDIKINPDKIQPRKALYWLSGGDLEWITLENYRVSWNNSEFIWEEEFGFLVKSIVQKSKNLDGIRKGFLKYLNLPTLYEFALEKNFIR
jgi:hypothetical protein